MTRNLFDWDRRWEAAAERRVQRNRELDLIDQGTRQRKDWRFGLFGEPKRAGDLKPEERCENATCECPWCESA